MYLDFHTHGKLAKYLPFSTGLYGLAAVRKPGRRGWTPSCLTEHFNTQQFDEVYGYIAEHGRPVRRRVRL